MRFRDMFKVRNPGKGDAWQKSAEKYTRAKVTIIDKGKGAQNGKDKKSV